MTDEVDDGLPAIVVLWREVGVPELAELHRRAPMTRGPNALLPVFGVRTSGKRQACGRAPADLRRRMKPRVLVSHGDSTRLLVLETGDEVVSELSRVAHEERLDAAHITAIGALSDATLGWFDPAAREYRHIEIAEQVEVLSLVGDVTGSDPGPTVHAHVVVGTRTGATLGGHLLEAHVRPTLELVLTETPADLRRRFDPKVGLALIDVDASESEKG